jgi:hypothetical protein
VPGGKNYSLLAELLMKKFVEENAPVEFVFDIELPS